MVRFRRWLVPVLVLVFLSAAPVATAAPGGGVGATLGWFSGLWGQVWGWLGGGWVKDGPALDPAGRLTEGPGLDPNGQVMDGPGLDPFGNKDGPELDPAGHPRVSALWEGPELDPAGSQ